MSSRAYSTAARGAPAEAEDALLGRAAADAADEEAGRQHVAGRGERDVLVPVEGGLGEGVLAAEPLLVVLQLELEPPAARGADRERLAVGVGEGPGEARGTERAGRRQHAVVSRPRRQRGESGEFAVAVAEGDRLRGVEAGEVEADVGADGAEALGVVGAAAIVPEQTAVGAVVVRGGEAQGRAQSVVGVVHPVHQAAAFRPVESGQRVAVALQHVLAAGDEAEQRPARRAVCRPTGTRGGGGWCRAGSSSVATGINRSRQGCGVLSLRTSIDFAPLRRWRPPLRATPPPSDSDEFAVSVWAAGS